MAMNVALARLVGFCLDIGLSVIYTGLFVGALRAWNRRRKNTDVSSVIPGVLIAMFILNAGQLCLQGVDAYDAFFRPPQDPIEYYNRFDSRILPSRDGIFWLLSILTDVLMIWRLYVVWLNSVRIIILPLGLLTAGIATGVVMFVYTIGRMYENSIHLSPEVDRWWMITLGFTIALNILTPTLIVARLWYIARHIGVLGSRSSRRYKRIAAVLMECGCLYTVILIGWLGIFASGSLPALWMGGCILPTLTAIVPTLIILGINSPNRQSDPTPAHIRVGRSWEVDTELHLEATTPTVPSSSSKIKPASDDATTWSVPVVPGPASSSSSLAP